jgi:hypothetical protein
LHSSANQEESEAMSGDAGDAERAASPADEHMLDYKSYMDLFDHDKTLPV